MALSTDDYWTKSRCIKGKIAGKSLKHLWKRFLDAERKQVSNIGISRTFDKVSRTFVIVSRTSVTTRNPCVLELRSCARSLLAAVMASFEISGFLWNLSLSCQMSSRRHSLKAFHTEDGASSQHRSAEAIFRQLLGRQLRNGRTPRWSIGCRKHASHRTIAW